MEKISVLMGQPEEFDKAVHEGLPEGGDIRIVVKEGAMVSGAHGIVITWTVQLPDGEIKTAQATTSLRTFAAAAQLLRARYPDYFSY